jgi:glucarate dehydratase
MKITTIRATPVNIPLEAPYLWSVGSYPGTTKVIVEVETDDGLVGIGEAPSLDCEPAINKGMAERLKGMDPFDLAGCEERCVPDTRVLYLTDGNVELKAFGGIEMALWDLKGKAMNRPLYQVLGGAVRKAIPFTEYYAYRLPVGGAGGEDSPAKVAAYCARMREQYGSTFFEGKCATGNPAADVRIVKEVRAAIGEDAMLRLDSNMAWSLPTARQLLADLEPYNIRNFEDPVANYFEMEKLRRHSRIPFSTHAPDLKLAARLGVPDAFVLNLSVPGGIARTLKLIAACEEMGIDFWFYSGETGVASAAYLHVYAATRHLREPSQSLFRFQTDDVIAEGPFKVKNNVIPVPEGPGLGVTLSPTGLKRCHERFLREGNYDQYHNPRKPGRFVRLPLD